MQTATPRLRDALTTFDPANDDDPFAHDRAPVDPHLQQLARVICSFEPQDKVLGPFDPSRCICRLPDGKMILSDVTARSVSQIGPSITYAEAGELATQVVMGSSPASTFPHVVHMLAIAYLAALAEAEQRRVSTQRGP
jgi:hypothetical protein